MTVLKPRSRMISVRLSEDEYSALQQMCTATGARSVSDLTRDAMRALLNGHASESSTVNYIDEFRAQLSQLDQKVEVLTLLIASSRTSKKPETQIMRHRGGKVVTSLLVKLVAAITHSGFHHDQTDVRYCDDHRGRFVNRPTVVRYDQNATRPGNDIAKRDRKPPCGAYRERRPDWDSGV